MRGLPTAAKWSCFHITILLAMCSGSIAGENGAPSFEIKMMYKYSDEFRGLMKGRPGMGQMESEWPRHSTAEFYHELALHDRHRHVSRNLLATDVYSLLPSNMTLFSNTMGGLHYSFILLGTPAKAFFVALDTGSDLLWVPCDCQQCSLADWTAYGINIPGLEFAVYSPSNSTTSKHVACTDPICTTTLVPGACDATAPQSCSYSAKYVSANTSSSGTIVQDVIYLNSETTLGSKFSTEIYFGCGRLQTGDFVTGGAPNGLFGLGPEIYSVPTTFARDGITKNVFSMCFSTADGSGRLVFGRKPAASLQSTPLIPIVPSAFYVLGIEGFVAGGMRLNVTQKVIFDTGTSLTIFPSTVVKAVGDALSSESSLPSFAFRASETLSLSHCWNITTNAEEESLSSLSIVFSGGGLLTINNTLLRVRDQVGNLLFVCLGILESNSSIPPIIGFNFMGNYEYFFDQETSTFSWGASDCSGSNGTSTTQVAPSISPEAPPLLPPVKSAPVPAKPEAASSSPPPSVALLDSLPPPPPPQFSEASSISFQPVPLLLLISFTFILLLSK